MELLSVNHNTSDTDHIEISSKMVEVGRTDLSIDFDGAKAKEKDLSFLKYYPHVTDLTIWGPIQSSLVELAVLPNLTGLGLSSANLKSISALNDLPSLQELGFIFGKIGDYNEIGSIANLKHLCLMNQRSLESLDFISNLKQLQYLRVDSCKNIEELPSFKNLEALRFVFIEKLGLKDLSPLLSAKALETLVIMQCNNIEIEEYEKFLNHPNKPVVHPNIKEKERALEVLGELGIASFYGSDHEEFELI